MRFLSSTDPIPLGRPEQRASAGSWALPANAFPVTVGPLGDMRDRIGYHAQNTFGPMRASGTGAIYSIDPARLLSAEQLHEIYIRCDDVRAAVDSVVRRVATWDWVVSPDIDPSDKRYEAALAECQRLKLWMDVPTANAETFQEVLTAFITDLLVQDAGALELVPKGSSLTGPLAEIPPMKGSDIHPIAGDDGIITHYLQEPRATNGATATIELPPEKVLYMRLFSNSQSLEGIPILESLVYRVISLLRGAESVAGSLTDGLPAGLLVITGIANEAADRVKKRLTQPRSSFDTMEIVTSIQPSQGGGVDYKWLEFRRLPRDLQVLEITKEFSRIVWRLFGVMPVEMGATEGMPRATAEVQLDASASHLIGPILELLQAKINSHILTRQVASKWRGLVSFKWVMKRQLSSTDALNRSKELGEYVDRGILTRNEARKLHPEGPFPPVPGGDTPTVVVAGSLLPLALALEAASAAGEQTEPADPSGSEDIEDIDEDASPDLEEDDNEEDPADTETEDEGRKRIPSNRPALPDLVSQPSPGHAQGRSAKRVYRSIFSGEMPSEWAGNTFEDTRTLDLPALWREIEGYSRDVLPLWEEARTATISALGAVYKESGFGAEDRALFMQTLSAELERLAARWTLAVAPYYERVAMDSRATAGRWTAYSSDPERAKTRAKAYRELAFAYLRADNGPLAEVRDEIGKLLVSVSDVRSVPSRDLRERLSPRATLLPSADTAAVLSAVGAVWDSVRHRVSNWAGKLIELSYQVLSEELSEGASTGQALGIEDSNPGETVDWWCEWVAAGGSQICADCQMYGSRGYQRLADLPTQPGGATRCRSNCKCVLVIWAKAEIDNGRAHYLSAYNK